MVARRFFGQKQLPENLPHDSVSAPILPISFFAFSLTAVVCGLLTLPARASAMMDGPAIPDLAISVSPQRTMIFPGHASTCTELDTAITSSSDGDGSTDDGGNDAPFSNRDSAERSPNLTSRPIVKAALRFPSFTLDHQSDGEFSISYAIVRISLPDQDYEVNVYDDELKNLLGVSDLQLEGKMHIVSNDSGDSRRQEPSPYAPCGLVINDIPIADSSAGFVAPVEVRIIGYSKDAQGNQSAAEVKTEAEAEYIP